VVNATGDFRHEGVAAAEDVARHVNQLIGV
jgi:hypothetical protein